MPGTNCTVPSTELSATVRASTKRPRRPSRNITARATCAAFTHTCAISEFTAHTHKRPARSHAHLATHTPLLPTRARTLKPPSSPAGLEPAHPRCDARLVNVRCFSPSDLLDPTLRMEKD